ncbi:hypothetical protein [Plebeiibacterium sediminum]|uniref:Uncharacterized protein n=1 Tax=Plebeiibacterium sediminum TaxID=2992112 RepID=A0AAE3SHA9_9BACT|nr:hypothetical protein [Plebeiobacterium sediminum]MCW3789358.1 hypothetical protein [Plebeiobacterium sediminum]
MIECSKDKQILPASHCVICGLPSYQSGNMIIEQKARGFCFSRSSIKGGNKDKRYISLHLNESKSQYMVFWGEDSFWQENAMHRAIKIYSSGKLPWFCSYCGKRVCSKCGCALASPVGSDFISNTGFIVHSPLLGVQIPCTNPMCDNYKTQVEKK